MGAPRNWRLADGLATGADFASNEGNLPLLNPFAALLHPYR
jgi:hypothetical protein